MEVAEKRGKEAKVRFLVLVEKKKSSVERKCSKREEKRKIYFLSLFNFFFSFFSSKQGFRETLSFEEQQLRGRSLRKTFHTEVRKEWSPGKEKEILNSRDGSMIWRFYGFAL